METGLFRQGREGTCHRKPKSRPQTNRPCMKKPLRLNPRDQGSRCRPGFERSRGSSPSNAEVGVGFRQTTFIESCMKKPLSPGNIGRVIETRYTYPRFDVGHQQYCVLSVVSAERVNLIPPYRAEGAHFRFTHATGRNLDRNSTRVRGGEVEAKSQETRSARRPGFGRSRGHCKFLHPTHTEKSGCSSRKRTSSAEGESPRRPRGGVTGDFHSPLGMFPFAARFPFGRGRTPQDRVRRCKNCFTRVRQTDRSSGLPFLFVLLP